ncbi:MAG: CDP-alcohol phosphatidyltransferase family protein [Halobacteriota archaeon]
MSLLYRFKPHKDRCLTGPTLHLTSIGVTANEITALGLCLALGAGVAAYSGLLYGGVALFIASALCDALDGSLARTAHKRTEFGLYFDGIADRFSELFFVVGVVVGAHVSSSAFFVAAGAFLLLFARIYAYRQKCGRISTTFGRPERLVLLIGGILCPAPLSTLFFVTAGLCCIFSAVQIVAQRTTSRHRSETGSQHSDTGSYISEVGNKNKSINAWR